MAHRAILVTGYGNSGVTAVMDLLAECKGYVCPASEFFLIQHPDGIMSLENALLQSWSEFGPDWAIRRFSELVDVLARPSTRFRFGLDYDKQLTRDFSALCKRYVSDLTRLEYDGHLMFRRSDMGRAEYLVYEVSRHLQIKPVNAFFARKYRTAFVSDPAVFMERTRTLMTDLLRAIAGDSRTENVALLLGASPYQVTRCERYFTQSATIIVDRDPRDIYLSAKASSYMPHDLDAFIEWYRSTRTNAWQGGDGNVLKLFFEDLVSNYEKNVAEIFRFLDIEPAQHTDKKSRLKPEASAKRIAKWKSYPNQEEIRRIEKELPTYLWNP